MLDPQHVLARGYAWLQDEAGQPITSVARLQVGQNVEARLADGAAELGPQDPLALRLLGAGGQPSAYNLCRPWPTPAARFPNHFLTGTLMEHTPPPLPYAIDAWPHYSKETLEFHHGKHHNAYVVNLNNLQKGTEFESKTLEEIVKTSSGGIYNNAAQIWNHTFFWNCMKPNGGGEPTGAWPRHQRQVGAATPPSRKAFVKSAVGNFGSGWTWLVKKADGSVDIVNTGAAGTPLTTGDKALLDRRRLGTRLLHRLPQPASEVRRDLEAWPLA